MSSKNILLVFGGASSEHHVSITSANSVLQNVEGHNIIPLYITTDGRWLLYEGTPANLLNIDWERQGVPAMLSPDSSVRGLVRLVGNKAKVIPIDVVLPMLHGKNGEDGTIQGLCQLAKIPVIGCGTLSSAVAMDKIMTKYVARALKIPHAPFISFSFFELLADKEMFTKIGRRIGYPCFVKPSAGGSSCGITKANNRKELEAAIMRAIKHDMRVIVEKCIVGREIEVAILGDGNAAKCSALGEIIPAGDFYDFDAKYKNPESKIITPAKVDNEEEIKGYAMQIFNALNCTGLARVDFFVTDGGKIYFNEINTMPGFTPVSMFPRLWALMDLDIDDIIEVLLRVALPAK